MFMVSSRASFGDLQLRQGGISHKVRKVHEGGRPRMTRIVAPFRALDPDPFRITPRKRDHEQEQEEKPWCLFVSFVGVPFLYGGTGSRVPSGTQGMQRNNREVVSQSPFGKPWARIASSE